MLLNAQSLLPKIDELRVITHVRSPSLICATETWLNDSVDSNFINIHNYQICRQDRSYRRGGGIAIYLSNDICFTPISTNCDSMKDVDFLVLDVMSFRILLVCLYIPPSVSSETLHVIEVCLTNIVDDFLMTKPVYNVIITGDLNKFKTKNLCFDLQLCDLVTKPTRKNNILEHI